MCSNAPTSLSIEVYTIIDKIKDLDEVDLEVLSAKKRLEKCLSDLGKYEFWRRSNLAEYEELENYIKHYVAKIDRMINKNQLEKQKSNILDIEKQIDEAIKVGSKEKLVKYETFLLKAKEELKKMSENSINVSLSEIIEEIQDIIVTVKNKIEDFYLQCVVNVETVLDNLKEIKEKYSGTRKDYKFERIHKLFEISWAHIRAVDIRDKNHFLYVKRRELIETLETLRGEFNEKVHMNETMEIKDSSSQEIEQLIENIQNLQKQIYGACNSK